MSRMEGAVDVAIRCGSCRDRVLARYSYVSMGGWMMECPECGYSVSAMLVSSLVSRFTSNGQLAEQGH